MFQPILPTQSVDRQWDRAIRSGSVRTISHGAMKPRPDPEFCNILKSSSSACQTPMVNTSDGSGVHI